MRPSASTVLRRIGAGIAVAVTVLGTSAAGMLAASAAVTVTPPDSNYTVSINQGNVPTTAANFGAPSCDEFTGKAATDDGWLFVASPDHFTSLVAVFDGGTVYYNDPAHRASAAGTSATALDKPSPGEHLAVTTPAGWTLENAYANLADKDGKADTSTFFTLSHTCAATQQPPVTAPAPTVSFTNSCADNGIDVTLGNTAGTAPAHFTVTYGGADHTFDVPAGGTQPVNVPVAEDTTGSVTVAAVGLEGSPVTHTWARNCTTEEQPPTVPAPTVTFDNSCEAGAILITLGNVEGTAPAEFTLTFGGSDHPVEVGAGDTKHESVPVAEDTTGSVTVAAAGLAGSPVTQTWSRDCSQTVPPEHHGVNPAVSFSTACATGITATLSNMKFDDTTTDAVTFTITTPTGAQEQVVVLADQITKRSYPVAEGTTGTVTVSAPGLVTQTKSYTKKCTSVLGEKVTKGPKTPTKTPTTTKITKTPKPAVEGEKVTTLPMTGAPAGAMVEGSLLLLLAGAGLSMAGRRRYQPRHASR